MFDQGHALVVKIRDTNGHALTVEETGRLHFSSKGSCFVVKRKCNGDIMLQVYGSHAVVCHTEGQQQPRVSLLPWHLEQTVHSLNRQQSDVEDVARLTLFSNLKHQVAFWFHTTHAFLMSSQGACLASRDSLAVDKKRKLFTVDPVCVNGELHVRWPLRVSMLDLRSECYLSDSHGRLVMDSPVKCCSEEVIIEIPSLRTTGAHSDGSWNGCLWSPDGRKVMSEENSMDGRGRVYYWTDQDECFGREEFQFGIEGKNMIGIKEMDGKKVRLEISSRPVMMASVYKDVLVPVGRDASPVMTTPAQPSRAITTSLSLSGVETERRNMYWVLTHHGEDVYSIVDHQYQRNLVLSNMGTLVFSSNPEDGYPNEKSLFRIRIVQQQVPVLEKADAKNSPDTVIATGFTIRAFQKYHGRELGLCAMPDGTIEFSEVQRRRRHIGELFTLIDVDVGQRSRYLEGIHMVSHFPCSTPSSMGVKTSRCLTKSFSMTDLHRKEHVRKTIRHSYSDIDMAGHESRDTKRYFMQESQWGSISPASAQTLALKTLSESSLVSMASTDSFDEICSPRQIIDEDVCQYLPEDLLVVIEQTISRKMTWRKPTKLSCFEVKNSYSGDKIDAHFIDLAEEVDEDDQLDVYICNACAGNSGLLPVLDPEINPQHFRYLQAMQRIQYGRVRRRRVSIHENGVSWLAKRLLLALGVYVFVTKARH